MVARTTIHGAEWAVNMPSEWDVFHTMRDTRRWGHYDSLQ